MEAKGRMTNLSCVWMKILKPQAALTAKGLQPEAAALRRRRCKGLCVQRASEEAGEAGQVPSLGHLGARGNGDLMEGILQRLRFRGHHRWPCERANTSPTPGVSWLRNPS